MPESVNVVVAVLAVLAGIAALFAVVWLMRKRTQSAAPIAPEEHPIAPEPDAQPEDAALNSNMLAIALVPVQMRVGANQVEVDYRLALDNCAGHPIVSLRAYLALSSAKGERDPERLGPMLSGPVSGNDPLTRSRLDPGEAFQQTGTLTLPLEPGEEGKPVVAIVRLRVLAANLAPQTSAWVIGKARHQPGARIAAVEPIDLALGRATHELLLARQIA